MERSCPRLLTLLLVLALAWVMLPIAQAELLAEDRDELGDVTSKPGVGAEEATVDLVTFAVERDGDMLILRNEVNATLPLPGIAEPNATRVYNFLFAVDFQSSQTEPLVQSADSVIVCTFHHGMADLECMQSQGNRTIIGVGTSDRNVTVRIATEPDEQLLPIQGGGAVTLTDEETGIILAQDWTPTTIGGQNGAEGEEEAEVDGATSWSKRPRTAVAIAGALIGLSYFAMKRLRKKP